jgi:hypothetical protein
MRSPWDRLLRGVVLALALICAPGCLVVSVHPTQERESLVFDPALLGSWVDAEDNASLLIERGEWQSYRIRYELPIESGEVTGHRTTIDQARYQDMMPAKGEDHGAFLVPVHVTLRVDLQKDRLVLTGRSYDWFLEHLRKKGVPGLGVVLDDKENALIVSPTAAMRTWLGRQPVDGLMFGASATFTRKPAG